MDTDLCYGGETQTLSHIVEWRNGGLSQLHSADDAAIAWLDLNHICKKK